MKLLIETSSYHLRNIGDLAMLRTAVERAKELLPESASTLVVGDADELIRDHCGVHADAQYFHLRENLIARSLKESPLELLPRQLRSRVRRSAASLKDYLSWITHPAHLSATRKHPSFKALKQRVGMYDAVIVSGGGFLTDFHLPQARRILWTARLAAMCDVPVAWFGQGIGPIKCSFLKREVQQVLGRAECVGVREAAFGPQLLESLGIDRKRVVVTGDDAIQEAWNQKQSSCGNDIGINVRKAGYSGFVVDQADFVADICDEIAQESQRSLRPIPICLNSGESDVHTIEQLVTNVKSPVEHVGENATYHDVLHQLAMCRTVVSGSYHGALFALSLGVPAIGLIGNSYYRHKFQGLKRQFPTGFEYVEIGNDDAPSSLKRRLVRFLAEADSVRPLILRRAEEQIAASRNAYQSFFSQLAQSQMARLPDASL